MATQSTSAQKQTAPNYTGPFITVAILFGIFGFLTSLNNVLVAKLEAFSVSAMAGRCSRLRRGFSHISSFRCLQRR